MGILLECAIHILAPVLKVLLCVVGFVLSEKLERALGHPQQPIWRTPSSALLATDRCSCLHRCILVIAFTVLFTCMLLSAKNTHAC
jgi:hypothetical protein